MPVAIPTMIPVPMNDCAIPPPGSPGGDGVLVKKSTLRAEAPFTIT